MNTEDNEKTPDRQGLDAGGDGGAGPEIMPQIGGFASPGGAAGGVDQAAGTVGTLMDAEAEPEQRGRGAPRKAKRARKDALRAYAARLGAEPGELMLETVMGGLQAHLETGGKLEDWLEIRSVQLARQLGTKRAVVFGQLVGMLKDLNPYVHQKLPQAVELEGGQVVFAVMGSDGQVDAGARAGVLDLRPANVRHDPVLINDKSEPKSDGDSRTDGEK